jgi:penicillin-binding protein 1A
MRIFRWIFFIVVAVVLTIAGAVAFTIYKDYWKELPTLQGIRDYTPPVATRIYDRDGTLIDEVFTERRYLVPIEKIPKHLRNAFVAAEDAEFYSHRGIDVIGISRAMLANLKAGGVVQGGSTITQQVVKALILTPERSYDRKLREALLAIRLETEFSKEEILELYLNQIYFGDGNYGVKAAVESYYGKELHQVTVAEAALLAGLPQAPSRYSPTRNPEAAHKRKRYVLRRMLEEGFINQGDYHKAMREEIEIASSSVDASRPRGYYTEYVRLKLEEVVGKDSAYSQGYDVFTAMDSRLQNFADLAVRRGLEKIDLLTGYKGPYRPASEEEGTAADVPPEYGRSAPPKGPLIAETLYRARITEVGKDSLSVKLGERDGTVNTKSLRWASVTKDRTLKVGDYVAVRSSMPGEPGPEPEPETPEELVEQGDESPQAPVEQADPEELLSLFLGQIPELQAGLIAIDIESGGLAAMVGGYDFLESQFNRATQAQRQPGSAFKPFIYSAALDNGLTPASVVYDEPIEYQDNDTIWAPQNYSRKYYGLTTLRTALEKSRNIVTVKVLDAVGVRRAVEYLKSFQFEGTIGPHLSIALGSVEMTLFDLTSGYTVFANEGVKIDPVVVKRITDSSDRTIWADRPAHDRAIPATTAALVTSMLEGVVKRGTGVRIRALGRPAAGKTGTTNDQRDAWFVGYTPSLVVGVWVGYDDHRRSMGRIGTGSQMAAPIWLDFMKNALEGLPVRHFETPEGINCVTIDTATGFRADLDTEKPFLECFKEGTEPRPAAVYGITVPGAPGYPGYPGGPAPGDPNYGQPPGIFIPQNGQDRADYRQAPTPQRGADPDDGLIRDDKVLKPLPKKQTSGNAFRIYPR